jgi:addiction module HigA family antidote
MPTRLPRNRAPTHPGEMLLEEFIKPYKLTQTEVAKRLGISFPRLSEIIHGHRRVTTDTALRLERLFGASAHLWLGLQLDWDLWQMLHSPEVAEIEKVEPLKRTA